jgi:glutamine amidotransferase
MRNVTLIDYGMGNLCSVQSAFEYVGASVEVTDDPQKVVTADTIVLPGVGSFSRAMQTLREKGLDIAIKTAVIENEAKILGICLGMQLLGSHSTEHGETVGLGLIPNGVNRFIRDPKNNMKIPHVGFNSVDLSESTGLFEGLPQHCDFYFVHSYRMLQDLMGTVGRIGRCEYGESFLAAFEYNNICGTQFHPEKSQTNGLRLLKNFLL